MRTKAAQKAAALRVQARRSRKVFRPKYFDFDDSVGKFIEVTNSRATNQNRRTVQLKVLSRLEKLPTSKLKATTSIFMRSVRKKVPLSKMAPDGGLHMAHGRSFAELKATMVFALNETSVEAVEEFVEDFLTTDASDMEDVLEHVAVAFSPTEPTANRLASSVALADRINRTAKNLTGGVAKLNMHIQSAQDMPSTTDNKPFPFMAKSSDALDTLQDKLGMDASDFAPLFERGKQVSSTR
jgi:hypothetical protein